MDDRFKRLHPVEHIGKEPKMFDIVEINGRWGQCGGGVLSDTVLTWLDDEEPKFSHIDLRKYTLELIDKPLSLREVRLQLTEDQLERIKVRGGLDPNDDNLKYSTTVLFGKYKSIH